MVRRDLPASVYRCKGVVYATEQPETRLVLQAVGRRTDLEPLGRWGDETRRSRIVAIGDRERMDSAALRAAFTSESVPVVVTTPHSARRSRSSVALITFPLCASASSSLGPFETMG